MELLILCAVALVVTSIGFKKFIYFISLGYGFSIVGIGIALLVMFWKELSLVTSVMSILLIVYGLRLGLYLLLREIRSKSYKSVMKKHIKDGSDYRLYVLASIWVSCAALYVAESSPIYFRLANGAGTDTVGIAGMCIMLLGIVTESASDFIKSAYKKEHPHRFCDVSIYKIVRCPNYFGEILIWTGVFVSGISIYHGVFQWTAATLGWICIVYIMFGGARRLELRQNKNYGEDPEYQEYVKKTPIIIPLVPLKSVAKYKWLVG